MGLFGLHRFILGDRWMGVAYFFSFGLLGVGWLVDFLRLPWLNTTTTRARPVKQRRLTVAYALWLPLGGLLGLYHIYLGNYLEAFKRIFTLNFLGIGWLADGVRMLWLVRASNKEGPEASGSQVEEGEVELEMAPPRGSEEGEDEALLRNAEGGGSVEAVEEGRSRRLAGGVATMETS